MCGVQEVKKEKKKRVEIIFVCVILTSNSSSHLPTGTFEEILFSARLRHKTEYHCLFTYVGYQVIMSNWFLCSLYFPSHDCGRPQSSLPRKRLTDFFPTGKTAFPNVKSYRISVGKKKKKMLTVCLHPSKNLV